jgi:hypothetical protein
MPVKLTATEKAKLTAKWATTAEWVKGNQLKFNWLVNHRADPKKAWGEVDPGVLFR